jgi:hypothetical protein
MVAVMIGGFIVASIMLLPILLFDIHLFVLSIATGVLGTFLGVYIYGFMIKLSPQIILLISSIFFVLLLSTTIFGIWILNISRAF